MVSNRKAAPKRNHVETPSFSYLKNDESLSSDIEIKLILFEVPFRPWFAP